MKCHGLARGYLLQKGMILPRIRLVRFSGQCRYALCLSCGVWHDSGDTIIGNSRKQSDFMKTPGIYKGSGLVSEVIRSILSNQNTVENITVKEVCAGY